jgi:hypothetical protein
MAAELARFAGIHTSEAANVVVALLDDSVSAGPASSFARLDASGQAAHPGDGAAHAAVSLRVPFRAVVQVAQGAAWKH